MSVVAVNRAGQGNTTTLTNFTKELGIINIIIKIHADTLLFAH